MDKRKEAIQRIKELAERFDENISQYKRPDYDEANTRTDFIDPFFENLGWDVANKQGHAEQYREVVREAKVTIAGKQRAPDYSFRIGGIRKFFVEAKKPSVDLKHEVSPAYQLKRYAYTAKLPLSILTDFEEFSVYDTRIKPTPKDSASCARIFYCRYKDYLTNFDFIYDTFSKDGLLKGSFDRYVESSRNKRGTSEVDKEFLKLIDRWREGLAKNIALRNKSLSLYELNFAVQKIIDRIIFLRIAEDRQIEGYGKLQNLLNGVNTYKRLMEIFLHSDKKYNSGLFDFNKDEITHSLSVDDKIIKEILKSVYYPESPYEFSVLDVEILGNIYEQFLGKTIRLTPAHQVKVEEKPEVKKAGGVYYTPKYIVDYIVKNTVGEIIKGKTPKQIDKIKLIDPACGSGSFLLGAYQELLNYHLDWYSKDTNRKKALKKGQIVQIVKNSFQLTIAEKQRVLLNNIFGVDIDTQAVEVSKLSLLLKLLEGETEESTGQLFRYTQIGLLPDLSNNIKCGNSLIGPDFYKQMSLLNDDEARRINAFDWESAFPDIFENGGFDIVIGNPPWVTLIKSEIGELKWNYYRNAFRSIDVFKVNTFPMFVEKSVGIVSSIGKIGLIIPNRLLDTPSYWLLRKELITKTMIEEIVDIPKGSFDKVIAGNILLFLSKNKKNSFIVKRNVFEEKMLPDIEKRAFNLIEKDKYVINLNVKESTLQVTNRIEWNCDRTKDLFYVHVGIMIKDKFNHFLNREIQGSSPIVMGRDFNRFTELSMRYIQLSDVVIFGGTKKPEKHLVKPKLFVRKTGNQIISTIDNYGVFAEQSVYLLIPKKQIDLKYICGVINSSLINFYFRNKLITNPESYPYIQHYDLEKIPIRTINFSNPSEKAMHDKLVGMVEKMLELQKKFHSVRLESDKEMYRRQIDVLDNQIDALVYELYGLTEEEINIIKSGS